jgi:serine/threonine protein kinase
VINYHPGTDDPLPQKAFVSIEERAVASPLSACRTRFTTEDKVSKLLLDLIEGLDLLWSRPEKIVHRDLKPANLLIRDDESVVIIDLGIVREEGTPGITYDDSPWGPCTPLYSSPEQSRNDKKNISFKSDFFALGTIAYELISGANPYGKPSDDARAIFNNVRNVQPQTLFKLGRASEPFSNIVQTLMKKEPFERYRTVPLFRKALLDFRKVSYGS